MSSEAIFGKQVRTGKEGAEDPYSVSGKKRQTFTLKNWKVDTRRALMGGGMAAAITLIGATVVGQASGYEAYRLLEVALSTTRSFCGTITLATGNILALMLTLIGLSANTDIDLAWAHYQRVEEIALADTITFVMAILIYLLLNVPISESEPTSDPTRWIAWFYYATLGLASILGGAVITVILMLFNTVRDLILVLSPSDEQTPSHLVKDEEE